MAKRKWVNMQNEAHVAVFVKTISGHTYQAEALGGYTCETDLGTADVCDFAWSLGPTIIKLDGELVLIAGLPEQDRVEVETAIEKDALAQVTAYMGRLRTEGRHPFRGMAA